MRTPRRLLAFTALAVAPALTAATATGTLPLDAVRFTSLDRREIDLARLEGKVVLLDFWAMWCGPCIRELFALRPLYAAYHPQGFEIVGIYCDKGSVRDLKAFLDKQGMRWPQKIDGEISRPDSLAHRFGITELPATYLIKDGQVIGRNLHGPQLEAAVRQALGLSP